jgi:hypothetical protein
MRKPRTTTVRRPTSSATTARYDAATKRIVLDLPTGFSLGIPIGRLPAVAKASPAELARVEVIGAGNVLHWEELDADYSVPALMVEALGRRLAMKEIARTGGRARTTAKADAARANGKKGGRPRSSI